ncbi:MAG: hypothetical protein QM727_02120 [Niabella sp.]
MKKLFILFAVASLGFVACNNAANETPAEDTTTTVAVDTNVVAPSLDTAKAALDTAKAALDTAAKKVEEAAH